MTTFWIIIGVLFVGTALSILLAPSQGLKRDNDPGPRWYWFF